MLRRVALWLAPFALLSPAAAPAAPDSPDAPDGATVVRQVGEEFSARGLADDLFLRQIHGLPVDHLPELTKKKVEADARLAAADLERLAGIDATTLGEEDRLSLELLRFQLDGLAQLPRYWIFDSQVLPYTSPISTWAQLLAGWSFPEAAAVDTYVRLLEQVPAHLAEISAHLDDQEAAGIRVPKPELDQVVPMLRAYAAAPDASPLAVAPARLAALPEAARRSAGERIATSLRERVAPAFERLAARLDGDYRQRAPHNVGLAQYPGGIEAYRWLIVQNTSLDLTPEQIHATGVAAVADLRQRMDVVRREVGFEGSLDEFLASLRKDSRFYAKSPEEIGERLMQTVNRVEPALDRFFLVRPRAPYTVRRLAPQLEGGQSFGHYDPPNASEPAGVYYYNGSHVADRSLLWASGLIAHELLPGHHFQIALAQENSALPDFRRDYFDSAFTEGWAEYAADLVAEMGAYADPYDRMGRLVMASMTASRLVVDTGMNALGWSRERAMDYLIANTMLSDTEVRSETLRYAVDMPGQALAYRLGENVLRDERTRAESALGDKFDIRRFHAEVLGHGCVPVSILRDHLERWIAAEKQR